MPSGAATTDQQASVDSNEDKGRQVLYITWTLLTISTIIVAIRVFIKIRTTRKLWWDDYMLLMAEFWGYYAAIMVTMSVKYGLGRHMVFLDDLQLTETLRYAFFFFGGNFLSPMFGRISFCLFLLSLVWHSSRIPRWPLYFFIVVQTIINCMSVILMYAQCGTHLSSLWNLDVPVILRSCWQFDLQSYWGYAAGSVNTATDLFLTIYPAVIVSFSSLSRKSRIGLITLLCMSFIAMIASAKKTIEAKMLSEYSDYSYQVSDYVVWSSIELNIVIIASTIPLLRPLFKKNGLSRVLQGRSAQIQDHPSRQFSMRTLKKGAGTHTLSMSSQDNILAPGQEPMAITRTVEVSVSYASRDRYAAHAAIIGLPME